MSDFAKRIAGEIKQADALRQEDRDKRDVENAAFVQREILKKRLAPDLWSSFRDKISRKCEEVNKELGKDHYRVHDELPDKLRVIKLSPIANLHMEFFADGSRIHFEAGSCVGDYLVQIDSDTGQAILSDAYQRVFDLESTAENLIGECLEKAMF